MVKPICLDCGSDVFFVSYVGIICYKCKAKYKKSEFNATVVQTISNADFDSFSKDYAHGIGYPKFKQQSQENVG